MSVLVGDCVEVMAGMEAGSVDAIVTDPPYGLEFMGKEWDRLDGEGWRTRGGFSKPGIGDRSTAWTSFGQRDTANATCATCGGRMRGARKCECESPEWRVNGRPLDDPTAAQASRMQQWHQQWATAALRVAKPGAWLLAFGGTRTVHRLTCALEDAGWVVRDMLCWVYASGFPKSRSSLKPAWEPIVLCRKPGPLRALGIEAARIGTEEVVSRRGLGQNANLNDDGWKGIGQPQEPTTHNGRWPANVVLTAPIFDGGWDGVVGADYLVKGGQSDGGASSIFGTEMSRKAASWSRSDDGTASRFFLIPKAPRRERIVDGQRSPHPTQKPEALIRHLVRLVTPPGGVVLDPFLGSGTLGVVCDGLGVKWIGIEREPEYAEWAKRRVAAARPEWERADA